MDRLQNHRRLVPCMARQSAGALDWDTASLCQRHLVCSSICTPGSCTSWAWESLSLMAADHEAIMISVLALLPACSNKVVNPPYLL